MNLKKIKIPALLVSALFSLVALDTAQAAEAVTPPTQAITPDFHSYAFHTCLDIHGHPEKGAVMIEPIIEEAARLYEVDLNDEKTSQDVAWLIRSGCTIRPDAYLSSIAARSVRAVGTRQHPVSTEKHPHAEYALTDCNHLEDLPEFIQTRLTDAITQEAITYYHAKLPDYWNQEYVRNALHNACELFPGSYVYEMIGKMVRSGQIHSGAIKFDTEIAIPKTAP